MGYPFIIKLYADAVQIAEGDSANDLNIRNNNPGNLRSWGATPMGEGGFPKFNTFTDGVEALWENFLNHFHANPSQTISEYVNLYAPPSDGNSQNTQYVATLCYIVNRYFPTVTGATTMSELLALNGGK